ncbi:MAG TPA: hypothetical protein PKK01_01705 [Mycobacterium sp.]|nr:hypothetical protein [Mycobacterium sp.]HPX38547.1 hypothetical protein [Mycobacterium sp.]HPZ96163.1 hypothetical protein [Mycobacterium sp.]HQC77646.1 hypothetical protein [Mycobacterium sp.]HQE14779.1 hypothetical protein [Mycobacterium sp.]
MDTTTPEPQDAPEAPAPNGSLSPDPAATPTAPTRRRGILSRPWTVVAIAAAGLLLGAGIFVAGLLAGKTFGGDPEWYRDHEAGQSQSVMNGSPGEDDESDGVEEADPAPASEKHQTDESQTDESQPAAKTPATTAPAPAASPASTPPAPGTR